MMGLLHSVLEAASGDDGWAHLGEVGNQIRKRKPDFDPRTYGFAKLMPLLEANSRFEVLKRNHGEGNPPVAFVRARRK
ncbi:OST-HTH/LOTUS domain-containing protein [Kitasatospora sp. NPDC059646]|uniref:OST-HTH/LOTUS domain-containing protein n=1 Tax=Kitasatospora sp. NPDC059646 TaxID=3346893 RepID=UPI00369ECB54